MKKSNTLPWSFSATFSLLGIMFTGVLALIQARIWNGPAGPGIKEWLLSRLAPDALVTVAANDLSRPPDVYFEYGHYAIVAYLLVLTAVWTGNYFTTKSVKNGLIITLSVAATANSFIYWTGEFLTAYARELFFNYLELPAVCLALLLVFASAYLLSKQSGHRLFAYLYIGVFLLALLLAVLCHSLLHALVLALLVGNLVGSLSYSADTTTEQERRSWPAIATALIGLCLLIVSFTAFAFIRYKATTIVGNDEQAPQLTLPEKTGIKVYVFNTGFNRMTKALSPGNPTWRPAPVFLIQHPTHGYVLFDCGIAKEVAIKGQGGMAFPMPLFFESKTSVDQLIDAQLARFGIPTDSIKTIIISHLHADHTGGLPLFAKANVITHTHAALPKTDGLEIVHASSFTPHATIIGTTFDLFGDSTLLLIESEGHTKDDLMVLVAADDGPVLLTGDAVVHFDWLKSTDVERLPENTEGAARVRNTIRKLMKNNQNLLVFPGHEIPTIPTERHDVLKLFPEQFTPIPDK